MFHVGQPAWHHGYPVIVVRQFQHTPHNWQKAKGYKPNIANRLGVAITSWPVGARYLVQDRSPRIGGESCNVWGVDQEELTDTPMLGGTK